MVTCGALTDAAVESQTLEEFSLAANEATPEMLMRRRLRRTTIFLRVPTSIAFLQTCGRPV